MDLTKVTQSITFVAIGVATRLWDLPILGRVQRDADQNAPGDGTADLQISLPCHFNPSSTVVGSTAGYIGNCVSVDNFTIPEGASDDNAGGYPVFIDPLILQRADDETSFWFVSDAVKYFFGTQSSPTDDADNPYVVYPTFGGARRDPVVLRTAGRRNAERGRRVGRHPDSQLRRLE